MSTSLFVILFLVAGVSIYMYSTKKYSKRETEFNDFAMKMQTDFMQTTRVAEGQVDYSDTIKDFYTAKGYTLSKHPDYSTDYIAKKDKNILFIRIQSPQNKGSITAKHYQEFVGQTTLYASANPIYSSYECSWVYVCSKMMCEQSANIYIKKYPEKLSFEVIAVEKVTPPKGEV